MKKLMSVKIALTVQTSMNKISCFVCNTQVYLLVVKILLILVYLIVIY